MTRQIISTRNNPPPMLTTEPWWGYDHREAKRDAPLGVCPSHRCRRVKACIAPHHGLYCQRTHLSPSEKKTRDADHPLRREIDRVPVYADHKYDFRGIAERIAKINSIKLDYRQRMTERWKAGEFDHLYGKYRSHGVVLQPPPREYVEHDGHGAGGPG